MGVLENNFLNMLLPLPYGLALVAFPALRWQARSLASCSQTALPQQAVSLKFEARQNQVPGLKSMRLPAKMDPQLVIPQQDKGSERGLGLGFRV